MKHGLFVFVLFFWAIKGTGQDKWSLQECIAFALKNNISIRQSDVQLRLSRIASRQTESTVYPTLSGNINSAYQHGLTTNPTTNILQSASLLSGSANVQAGYTLFTWGARKNSIEANRLLAQADQAGVEKAQNDVSLGVANAFLQVMLRREQARISEAQVKVSSSQLDNTRKLVNAGSQPELNALQLEAQLAKDSSAWLQAQSLVQQALINLKAYINYDFELPFEIEAPAVDNIPIENISDLQPADVYRIAVVNQPAQRMYKIREQANERQVKAARGSMYPSLSLFAGMSSSVINSKYPVTAFVPADTTSAYVTVSGTQYKVFAPSQRIVGQAGIPFLRQLNQNFGQNVGISLNFSVFNNFTQRAQWERAKANVILTQLQNEQENLNLRSNIYNAYQDAFSSLQKYNASKRTVEYSRKALDISKKRFDIGLLGTLDYIITQNNLYLAQIEEVSNHYDYVFKMKVLEFYKGLGVRF